MSKSQQQLPPAIPFPQNYEAAIPYQIWHVMGEVLELPVRYKIIDYLGSGAYGTVCTVVDTNSGGTFAVKKCKKVFNSKTLAKRTVRELRLLRHFAHDNIIKLNTVIRPSDLTSFSDVYLIFDLMDTDLAQIIKSPQTLKEEHIQYFIYQLLLALHYIHSAHIIHRDIK